MVEKNKNTSVVGALRQVVADSYALLAQTHLCHWNVRGPEFFALHAAFEAQYTELFAGIDEVAERVRALGALAPGGLSNLAGMSEISELDEDTKAEAMVRHLSLANELVVNSLKQARDVAADAGDAESEDLCIARTQVHQKTVWMLNSFLG